MADSIPHPKMDWGNADRPQAFREFRQTASMWFRANKITTEDHHDYIILWSGSEGLCMFNTWGLADDELHDPKNIWDKFFHQIEPQDNFRIHRLEFQLYVQGDHESVDDFYTRCKAKAMKCQFTDVTALDERMNEVLKKKIIGKDKSLLLKDALDVCRAHEASIAHMAQLNHIGKETVYVVAKRGQCKNCGGCHAYRPKDLCPTHGTKCRACCKLGHWQHMCLSNSGKAKPRNTGRSRSRNRGSYSFRRKSGRPRSSSCQERDLHAVDYDDIAEQFESMRFDTIAVQYTVDSMNGTSDTCDELFATLDIMLQHCPGSHTLCVNTGAQGNIRPLRTVRRMFSKSLDADGYPKQGSTTPHRTILTAYNGTHIQQYGCITLPCRYGDEG